MPRLPGLQHHHLPAARGQRGQGREGEGGLPQPPDRDPRREDVHDRSGGRAGRRQAEPPLELRRALLPQPGGGGLGLRERDLPERVGRVDPGLRRAQVEARSRRSGARRPGGAPTPLSPAASASTPRRRSWSRDRGSRPRRSRARPATPSCSRPSRPSRRENKNQSHLYLGARMRPCLVSILVVAAVAVAGCGSAGTGERRQAAGGRRGELLGQHRRAARRRPGRT